MFRERGSGARAFRWGHIVFTFQDLPSGFPEIRVASPKYIAKLIVVHFIKMQVTEFSLPNQDGKHLSVSMTQKVSECKSLSCSTCAHSVVSSRLPFNLCVRHWVARSCSSSVWPASGPSRSCCPRWPSGRAAAAACRSDAGDSRRTFCAA